MVSCGRYRRPGSKISERRTGGVEFRSQHHEQFAKHIQTLTMLTSAPKGVGSIFYEGAIFRILKLLSELLALSGFRFQDLIHDTLFSVIPFAVGCQGVTDPLCIKWGPAFQDIGSRIVFTQNSAFPILERMFRTWKIQVPNRDRAIVEVTEG